MPSINAYLYFNGNTEEAFNFYRSVFGGEFLSLQRFKDTPEAGNIPANKLDKIMHVSLPIGNGNILMATDVLESAGHVLITGTNFSLSVNVDSDAEADRIFDGLSAGGKIDMPMQKAFWGSYFGMFTDRFGIQWMISHETPQQK